MRRSMHKENEPATLSPVRRGERIPPDPYTAAGLAAGLRAVLPAPRNDAEGAAPAFLFAAVLSSRVRSFLFKEYGFFSTPAFSSMVTAALFLALLFTEPRFPGSPAVAVCVLSGPFLTCVLLPRRSPRLLGNLTRTT